MSSVSSLLNWDDLEDLAKTGENERKRMETAVEIQMPVNACRHCETYN